MKSTVKENIFRNEQRWSSESEKGGKPGSYQAGTCLQFFKTEFGLPLLKGLQAA